MAQAMSVGLFPSALVALLLTLWVRPICAGGGPGGEEAVQGICTGGGDDGDSCVAAASPLSRSAFWKEMRRKGLQIKLKSKTVVEKARPGQAAGNRTAMVLAEDVFYGRAIIKVPRAALLSSETVTDLGLRAELAQFLFEKQTLERVYNKSGEDAPHLLSLAYPLIAENRDVDSVFRLWLDAVRDVRLPVLQLTERQRKVLSGTTVELAYDEMVRNRDLIEHTAPNISFFRNSPVSTEEATWALAVVMRHARVVHPHQDVRDQREPRMYLFPFVELLSVQLHPDPETAISFQEEITLEDGKREEEMVLQIARRDMPKGDEIHFWPGRLSNSEMVVRHGISFPLNHVGIGRNVSQPPNWQLNKDSQVRKEYDKYNCSSLESFEMRFDPRGHPMRNLVRCFRVSWFLTNGWYSPAYASRILELNKWPPPKKYSKEDWLAWTQADAELNRHILDYCSTMRALLKDTMDAASADHFRKSSDPMDQLLWHVRSEETKTFKECMVLAKRLLHR